MTHGIVCSSLLKLKLALFSHKQWLFSATSSGFGYGYEAVRIRVKLPY
jgi:hypothetical protein